MMQISKENILEYEKKYNRNYKKKDELVEKKMKELLERQRYLTRKDFIEIALWKSKRPSRHYKSEENDGLTVKETTQFCFNTRSERARAESLMILAGVSWPVASTILHFAFPYRYAIMDFRIIWSLGWKIPLSYNFTFWQRYCNRITEIARKYDLSVRTVDKALWQYSKEHQRRRYSKSN